LPAASARRVYYAAVGLKENARSGATNEPADERHKEQNQEKVEKKPAKPKTAAMIATTKNASAQRNISVSSS
jgi:hypothetical protein